MTRPLIALLSDFGTRDWYVAAIRGVILSKCPEARLVDVTHEIPPQDILAGAFTLAAAAPWFPANTIFIAVVDPGVGSDRALIAARADRRYFVGPDNGVLDLALSKARAKTIVRLSQRRYWLSTVSRTFQGRDIMAPVAAHLARGTPLSTLGRPIHHTTHLPLPGIRSRGRGLQGSILHIDAFGNLITNLPATLLGSKSGAARPTVRYQRRPVRVVSSYADGRPRELVALANSLGLVELAIREGSAAWTHNAKRGEEVELLLAHRAPVARG